MGCHEKEGVVGGGGRGRRWERKKIRVSSSFSLGFPPDG